MTVGGLVDSKVLIIIGALLSAIGGLYSNEQHENDAKQLTSFQYTIQEKDEELLKNSIALAKKSDELARKSAAIQNSVTGGTSFCYLAFWNDAHSLEQGSLGAIHVGKDTIYGVQARIVDIDRFRLASPEELEHGFGTTINVGDLTLGHAIPNLIHWKETVPGKLRLNVFFVARNGDYTELYRRVRVGTRDVALAIRVYFNGSIVYEKVSKNYPRDNAGKVVWQ